AYPFPAFEPSEVPETDRFPGTVIDAGTSSRTSDQELSQFADANDVDAEIYSVEIDVATAVELTLLTQEPGQLLVALDGVVVTNDGEELGALGEGQPGPWREADPALRQGFWRGYAASGFHQSFDSATLSALGIDITDDRVRVSVIPRGFNGEGWQVIAAGDAGRPPGSLATLAPGYAATLPEFAHGLERVGAFSVPTDGREYEVPLPVEQAEELTWIGACDLETTISIRTVTLRSPTRTGLIPCASYRNEWAAPLSPGNPGPPPTEATARSNVMTLAAPDIDGTESLTIGAYRSVPFEDFPFGKADQPSTAQLNLRPVPDEGDLIGFGLVSANTRWESVDSYVRAGPESTDPATVQVPGEAQALLSVTTRGKGRFRVETQGRQRVPLDGNFKDASVLGRVASPLMYRDGWWTSWTSEPTRWTIPIPAGRDARDGGLRVRVEGYDPGSLEIVVLEAVAQGVEETTEADDTLDP
ncbi:MAG: hypothetical protein WBG57_05505, partial [Ornithinimicrobium sp.]